MEDFKKIKQKIEQEAEDYLSNFGFDFVYGDNSELYGSDDWVGQYEHESVFSDAIKVYVNDNIAELSDNVEADLRVTVFHEIGHAFIEYLNELEDEQIERYLPEFFDIFYDDNGVDEEDICEDFGYSFDKDNTYAGHEDSLLRKLLDKMLDDGFEF